MTMVINCEQKCDILTTKLLNSKINNEHIRSTEKQWFPNH